ncbi:LegC family aminotransferase [bacterium]|nr:LegC family aminotransferase [bacterium]MBU1634074.1 LegC family aminotransferase [bacterium]MBU1874507.1 LegC family aminotransferase [bacterium]
MSEFIPLSVPSLQGNEWQYIKECLDTEWVSTAGKYVDKFENSICDLTQAKYAVACVNGTAALHIALKIIGVTSDDEVIVPTLTFISPINAVKYVNASPIFMDCDEYYTIDCEKTIEFILTETEFKNGASYNKRSGKRIPAIIIVHVFGNAVNVFELLSICRERNIRVVEDSAESIGSYYIQEPLLNKYTGTIGDIGCYSFNGNKIITCGGGGMIVTNDEEYGRKARYLTTQAKDDEVRYIHHEVGYNYRLTNIQAALGVAQLEQLQKYITIKKTNYLLYKNQIDNIEGLSLAEVPQFANSNYWLYCLRIDQEEYGKNREELLKFLLENQIQSRPVWYLNHMQRPYQKCQNYKIEQAYIQLERTLNIPCSVNITSRQIERVIEVLQNGKK